MWTRVVGGVSILGLLALGAGCSRVAQIPSGVSDELIAGTAFQHRVFRKVDPGSGQCLRVYIEGDGGAWLSRSVIASDPTPTNPVMLRAMAVDSNPAVYLGRPCYWGLANSLGCDARYWTTRRYGPEVVQSTAAAVERVRRETGAERVELIGHSGGGVLAVLVAAELEGATSVVTLGAPLDLAAWARHHDYSPLVGSLNPAAQPPLPLRVRQVHLVGGLDENVPPLIQVAYLQRNPGAIRRLLPGVRHEFSEYGPDQIVRLVDGVGDADCAKPRARAVRQ